jgi:hypothetical protein
MVEFMLQAFLEEVTGGKAEALTAALEKRAAGWTSLTGTAEAVRLAIAAHDTALRETEEAARAACDILRAVNDVPTVHVRALEGEVEACNIARATLIKVSGSFADGTIAIASVFPADIEEPKPLDAAAQAEAMRAQQDPSDNDA